MMTQRFAGALALALALVPVAAQADDPNDPAMRSAAARARDRAMIKKMNENQLAYVRQRDAGYAEGWRAWRDAGEGRQPARSGDPRADADYADARADYQRQMAEWRHAVSACRSGQYEYCAR